MEPAVTLDTTPAAAPAAPVAPTPAAPASEPEIRSVRDVIDSIVSRPPSVETPPSAAPEGAAEPPADPGDASGDGAPAGETPTPEQPTPEPTPTPPQEFEAADGSRFKVKGPDGKYTEIPGTLGHVEFTVEGKDGEAKTYTKSVGELVSLGRRAVALDRVVAQTKAETEQIRSEAEQQAQLAQGFIELMREVFADESGAAWEKRREEFLQLTSPEARAKRAEAELESFHRSRQAMDAEQQAIGWYQQAVQPVVTQVWTGAPDVSDEAKLGKINMLTAHLTVNGVVPPERRGEFAEIIAGPFAQWAKAEQARVGGMKAQQTAADTAATQAAQRAAQQKVNQAARGAAPVGHPAPDIPARAKPKTKAEAISFIARRPAP